jgi:microcystin-dependent protein
MATPFIGQIGLFGFDFAPRNWAFCNGQLLQIAQNTALFSLLGTTYGGNGTTNFALPNMQSRVPVGQGTGPVLSPATLGQQFGTEGVTLTLPQIPAHTHALPASSNDADNISPAGRVPAKQPDLYHPYASGATVAMRAGLVGNAGSSQAHSNMQPFLAINFCIALTGIFPSRN